MDPEAQILSPPKKTNGRRKLARKRQVKEAAEVLRRWISRDPSFQQKKAEKENRKGKLSQLGKKFTCEKEKRKKEERKKKSKQERKKERRKKKERKKEKKKKERKKEKKKEEKKKEKKRRKKERKKEKK